MATDWNETLRKACKRDRRTTYALAKLAGLHIAPVQRFVKGESDLTLASAQKLCAVLGYRLTRTK